jgi:hypothetical protein
MAIAFDSPQGGNPMKNLGKFLMIYFLFYLGLFALSVQAFGFNASILTFGIVHFVAFVLILTWLWLEQMRMSKGPGKSVMISPFHARRKTSPLS